MLSNSPKNTLKYSFLDIFHFVETTNVMREIKHTEIYADNYKASAQRFNQLRHTYIKIYKNIYTIRYSTLIDTKCK